jgi:enoyl-CoA hydratase/carnithine racemase
VGNEYVRVERDAGIVTLTMDDQPTLNAWNAQMGAELLQELTEAENSPEDLVVILTGAGQRGFNSGANMKQMVQRGSIIGDQTGPQREDQRDYVQRLDYELTAIQKVTWKLRSMPKPTIAAVNGGAAGGGMGLAAACDIRIASENAKFTSVFVLRGLVPDEGSLYFLPQIIGLSRTFELCLTGKLIDAYEAERIGFVSRVVPPDDLMPEVIQMARNIAMYCPPITTGLIKSVLTKAVGWSFKDTMALADNGFRISTSTEDHRESIRAYGEHRPPQFERR